MGYHIVDTEDLPQWDDRPTDVRSLSVAAGYSFQESPLGIRIYTLSPGEQASGPHHHDVQVEMFYVLNGSLHVNTPTETHVINQGQAIFIDPGSPQQAVNPEDAQNDVQFLAIGAPSVDDAQSHDSLVDS